MVILLRAAELNLDNYSCNMIFAHRVEWTGNVLVKATSAVTFSAWLLFQNINIQSSESAEVFKSELMMIGILPLWVLFGVFPIFGVGTM